MKLRSGLSILIVLSGIFFSVEYFPAKALYARSTKDSRPNILLIMTDQQFAGAMSCAGNTDLHTPNMDLLAEQGVRFTNAYCAQPLCTPSRSTIFTGKMPHETGITNNNYSGKTLPQKTMGTIMTEAGYDCGYVGKWHLPDSPADYGFSYTREIKTNNIDDKLLGPVAEFLNVSREKPFLLVVSFINPHDICEWARDPGTAKRNGEAEYITDPPIDRPPAPEDCPELPANFEVSENEPEIIRQINKSNNRIYPPGTYPGQWTDGKWRQYRWAYNRMVEVVDMFIGQVLQELKDSGQEENTVVIFTSDHGDGYAAHRWNQKWIHYEESVRVPLIISQKGVTKKNITDNRLVAMSEDLLPTICDYAGITPPDYINGFSLKGLAEGAPPSEWRNYVVSETEWVDDLFEIKKTIKARMLRTERYKYIVYSRASIDEEDGLREQLFDMKNDPGEMINLAVDIKYLNILEKHRKLLQQWIVRTNDDFIMPKGIPTGLMDRNEDPVNSTEFRVLQNFPNPFYDNTTIGFELPLKGLVSVSIYDVTGNVVAELVNEEKSKGFHTVVWSAKNSKQQCIKKGRYLCRVKYNGHTQMIKMIYLV